MNDTLHDFEFSMLQGEVTENNNYIKMKFVETFTAADLTPAVVIH